MKRRNIILAISLIGLMLNALSSSGYAAKPVVRAVLFFSPTCPHCHKVMTQDLPPLQAKYGAQLQIAEINILEPEGQELYKAAVRRYNIPPDRRGVPTLIVGDQVLVGSGEIPERFPDIIAQGLAAGGIDWPDIPGFQPPTEEELAATTTTTLSLRQRLAQDPWGNALAVLVLIGMTLVAIWSGFQMWHSRQALPPEATAHPGQADWRVWAIPILALIGLEISIYLSYVEITQSSAICGPVGNCNAVQQSPYARFVGIPVGVLGVVGYLAVLAAWAGGRWTQGQMAARSQVALLAITGVGLLFSIYLTFLEPFVIGASCLWCLGSAATMTGLYWLSWPVGLIAWQTLRPPTRRGRKRRRRA